MSDTPAIPIARDMAVLCPDGPLGRVDSAVVSPRTGLLARLVVELAYRPERYVVVPADWVASVEASFVHLARPRSAALALPLQRRNAEGWLQPAVREAMPEPVAPPPDAELAETVRRALAEDTLTADGAIDVAARSGVVDLTGRVRTAAAKFQATRRAREMPGVWLVRNELVSDEALLMELRRRLLLEEAVRGNPPRLEADLGRITLHGVATAEAAELVKRIADSTPGVAAVDVAATADSPPPGATG